MTARKTKGRVTRSTKTGPGSKGRTRNKGALPPFKDPEVSRWLRVAAVELDKTPNEVLETTAKEWLRQFFGQGDNSWCGRR